MPGNKQTGLYSGLSAAIARQMSYTTLRLGFFDEIKAQLAARNVEETAVTRCVVQTWGWHPTQELCLIDHPRRSHPPT